jgi:enamine deaminase RidA (YjgF/YER057c/UK114 family)
VIETSDAPEPFGWEPQAVKAGDLVFLSTQRAVDSRGILSSTACAPAGFERYVDDGRRQMDEILGNIAAIVEAAGTTLQNVCRIKVFMDDWSVMPGACQAIAEAFPNDPPAVSLHRVNGAPMLAPGVHIAADVIAYAP